MIKIKLHIRFFLMFIIIAVISCDDSFDVKYDADFKPEQVFVNYDRLRRVGMKAYLYVPSGFNNIGGAFLAAATDEAEHTNLSSSVQKFNMGSWNQYSNPDDQWANLYQGIYYANFFLEESENYKEICIQDTITINGKQTYKENIQDIAWLRNEVRFLRAYFHFELMKRYGEIPIVTKTLTAEEALRVPRYSLNDCIDFIEKECFIVKDSLVVDWVGFKDTQYGRVTKGTALALRSRVLLYAASTLYNPENDIHRWKLAASAAHDVMSMNKYSLYISYNNLFKVPNSYQCSEIIFMRMQLSSNSLERANYPVGTDGGNSGTCPTQNMVDAYEMRDGSRFNWNNPAHASNPYQNRDPRLGFTIAVNGSTWNGRTIESFVGGIDGIDKKGASRTGYYLKKHITENLNLTLGQTSIHSWILFRYGEILLNYAEAMNEAYGPDDDNGFGLTSRQVINQLRGAEGIARRDVRMPAVTIAKAQGQSEMRNVIRNERRIELAFEDHRFWDVKRWSDNTSQNESVASNALGTPVKGILINKNEDKSLSFSVFQVESRVFSEKMLWYPIPQVEINKYPEGQFKQNIGWN